MEEDLIILKVYMKKVKGTEHDYELITELDSMFKDLSESAQEIINEITSEYVKSIKEVIKIDEEKQKECKTIE